MGLLFAALVLAFAMSASAQEGPIAGGYADTETTDAGVVAAAKYAVKKQALNSASKITLGEIKNAKVQVVAGMNYQLCMQVTVKKGRKKAVKQFVQVVVYRNLQNQLSLTSWTLLKDANGC